MDHQPKLNHQYNTNLQNFVDYPVRLLKFILKKLKIRELLKSNIKEQRSRIDHYELDASIMFILLMHLFRFPSKNQFYLSLKRAIGNEAIAKFSGFKANSCPSPRTIDDILLKLNPKDFSLILPSIFKFLCRQKVFKNHPEWTPNGEFSIAIDAQASHTYYEHSQHPCEACPYCLKRTREDKVWYVHYELIASFIAPNGLQIPLLIHRIKGCPQWGKLNNEKWKQECERTAIQVLLTKLRELFPRLPFCIHLDALYAIDPIFNLLHELKMGCSIVRKVKVLKSVGEDCRGLKQFSEPVHIFKETKYFNVEQIIYYFNQVTYQKHHLNIIQLDEKAIKKPSKRYAKVRTKKTHWEWIVHQNLTKNNVAESTVNSRIRWKQEDLFNSLQCRGFAMRHDFNRAPNAQSVRFYLMLIAFAISSILTCTNFGRKLTAQGFSLIFLMQQMFTDIIYLSQSILECPEPVQLRFGKDPP
jgi:hypothetical protein